MKYYQGINLGLLIVLVGVLGACDSTSRPASNLPFRLDGLVTADINGERVFLPPNEYNIFVNYELGMHCVGFDMNYCCVIPPYNSIQAQAVRTASADDPSPYLLSPEDGVGLWYGVDNNTYSEGDKMAYWGVSKDANRDGDKNDPNDNIANHVWTHLYIYQDLEGTLPQGRTEADRLHVGLEIPVQVDHGPSGAAMAGFASYADEDGGNVVFTESRYGGLSDIPLVLTASHLWDALGLPLTAFNDGTLKGGSHRTIEENHLQPFQRSRVTLYDSDSGEPVIATGEEVSFFGTNPVDIPNCVWCHSSDRANAHGDNSFTKHKEEYDYWMKTYPDQSEFMARLSAASISILEIHDARHDTDFLAEYNPNASSNRLGTVGTINCSDCHGDNVQGRLKVEGETPEEQATPLTVGIHAVHLSLVPDPDSHGRSQSCQMCHPTHFQDPAQNISGQGFSPITQEGDPRFSDGDVRQSGGGCYLRRDAHANPAAEPPFFLNSVGEYLLDNVATVEGELRGLYCTNCHNHNAQELYGADALVTAQNPGPGETLRNSPLTEIAAAVSGSDDVQAYAAFHLDPMVGADGNPLVTFYSEHEPAPLPEVGEGVTYADASAGIDWWLAASQPHCADCHVAPFVEGMGGAYFPIDQVGKYSLYRYSKAHANLACQSCHESMHGLYPAAEDGADVTTVEQARQFSPDGEYAGPVTCPACHAVGANGVPVQLAGTAYYDDYWAGVVLIHYMRDHDFELPISELLAKYPYADAAAVVARSLP
jgi:mono/diheme cytochrome c family protein